MKSYWKYNQLELFGPKSLWGDWLESLAKEIGARYYTDRFRCSECKAPYLIRKDRAKISGLYTYYCDCGNLITDGKDAISYIAKNEEVVFIG